MNSTRLTLDWFMEAPYSGVSPNVYSSTGTVQSQSKVSRPPICLTKGQHQRQGSLMDNGVFLHNIQLPGASSCIRYIT